MSGLGYGIGSFLDGLADGVRAGQEMGLQRRRMELAEDAARRDRENDAFNRSIKEKEMGWKEKQQADWEAGAAAREAERQNAIEAANYNKKLHSHSEKVWGYEEEKLAAEKPVEDVERASRLTKAELDLSANKRTKEASDMFESLGKASLSEFNAERDRTILPAKDATGKDIFTVDGQTFVSRAEAERAFEQKHGSFTQRVMNGSVRAMKEHYLSIGDLAKADALDTWSKNKNIEKGMETAGRFLENYYAGDWKNMADNWKELQKNSYYMPEFKSDVEPIIKDGKPSGVKVTRQNGEGQTFTQEITDINDPALVQVVNFVTNPAAVFGGRVAQIEQIKAADAASRKKRGELEAELPFELAKDIPRIYQKFRSELDDSTNPEVRKMSSAEKDAYAMEQAQGAAVMAMGGSTPRARRQPTQAQAAQPPLASRPQGAAAPVAQQPPAASQPQPARPVIVPQPQGRSIVEIQKAIDPRFVEQKRGIDAYMQRNRLGQ